MRGLVSKCSVALAALATAAALAGVVGAQPPAGKEIRSKAVELGLDGSLTSVEGASTSRFGVRLGQYRRWGGTLVEYALGLAHVHVSDLDELDLELRLAASWRLEDSSAYAVVSTTAALRQEWIGSFNHVRYPLGFGVGLKALASSTAAGSVAYEFRRVTNDPVRNVNEHRIVVGLSILFANQRKE